MSDPHITDPTFPFNLDPSLRPVADSLDTRLWMPSTGPYRPDVNILDEMDVLSGGDARVIRHVRDTRPRPHIRIDTDGNQLPYYRLVHKPQVGQPKNFVVTSNDLEYLVRTWTVLANQHRWLHDNHVIPDFANILWIEALIPDDSWLDDPDYPEDNDDPSDPYRELDDDEIAEHLGVTVDAVKASVITFGAPRKTR